MNPLRTLAAWTLYGVVGFWARAFLRPGPAAHRSYRLYYALLNWSGRVQGDAAGPWPAADYRGADGHE